MTAAEVVSHQLSEHDKDIALLKQADRTMAEKLNAISAKMDKFFFLLIGTLFSALGACIALVINLLSRKI